MITKVSTADCVFFDKLRLTDIRSTLNWLIGFYYSNYSCETILSLTRKKSSEGEVVQEKLEESHETRSEIVDMNYFSVSFQALFSIIS